MFVRKSKVVMAALLAAMLGAARVLPAQEVQTADQILAELDHTASAQLKALNNKIPIDWVGGSMLVGYYELAHVSKNPEISAALMAVGNEAKWTPMFRPKAPLHADDHCVGQTFLDLYVTHHDPAMLAPTQARMDTLVEHINTWKPEQKQIWWWCDSLFMAPALLCRMSAVTGDPKYLDAMDKEWARTRKLLFDKQEHLYYRDATYLFPKKTEKNGKKMFWSRGNGWVFAGLCHTLEYMPPDHATRPVYTTEFKQMADKLLSLQGTDGMWRVSLLDPQSFPNPETSGTAFYCYGFAWGINNGLLEREKFLPAAIKAWAGLRAVRRADGIPGYVQAIGSQPASVSAEATQLYATGGFLSAGLQMMKLAPLTLPPPPALDGAPAAPAATTKP